jgi:hypothetical protein
VGLGVKFTEVCTLAPEFWDILWVKSSVTYGSKLAGWEAQSHILVTWGLGCMEHALPASQKTIANKD